MNSVLIALNIDKTTVEYLVSKQYTVNQLGILAYMCSKHENESILVEGMLLHEGCNIYVYGNVDEFSTKELIEMYKKYGIPDMTNILTGNAVIVIVDHKDFVEPSELHIFDIGEGYHLQMFSLKVNESTIITTDLTWLRDISKHFNEELTTHNLSVNASLMSFTQPNDTVLENNWTLTFKQPVKHRKAVNFSKIYQFGSNDIQLIYSSIFGLYVDKLDINQIHVYLEFSDNICGQHNVVRELVKYAEVYFTGIEIIIHLNKMPENAKHVISSKTICVTYDYINVQTIVEEFYNTDYCGKVPFIPYDKLASNHPYYIEKKSFVMLYMNPLDGEIIFVVRNAFCKNEDSVKWFP